MSSQYIDLPGYGDIHWKAPVATASLLPVVGNNVGDARVAQDTQVIYVWSGSAWVAEQNGGVTSLNSLTGALSLTSSDSSITITPSGSTINLEVAAKMRINLSPDSAAITDASDDCTIVETAGTTNTGTHWTQAQFVASPTVQNARFVLSGVATKDYAGGAITCEIQWNSAGTSGNVVWAVGMISIANGGVPDQAYNSLHSTTVAVAGTTNEITTTTISFTPSGTELIAGDLLFIEFQRTASSDSDTLASTANVLSFGLYEN